MRKYLKKVKGKVQEYKYSTGAGLATGLATVSTGAFAQDSGIDVSSITSSFAEVGVAVAAIGAAMLVAIGAGIAFRWVVAYLAK